MATTSLALEKRTQEVIRAAIAGRWQRPTDRTPWFFRATHEPHLSGAVGAPKDHEYLVQIALGCAITYRGMSRTPDDAFAAFAKFLRDKDHCAVVDLLYSDLEVTGDG